LCERVWDFGVWEKFEGFVVRKAIFGKMPERSCHQHCVPLLVSFTGLAFRMANLREMV